MRLFARRPRRFGYAPLVFATLIVTAAVVLTYRSELHRVLWWKNPYQLHFDAGDLSVDIGRQDPAAGHRRLLKISFPLAAAPAGCEFVYGAAVYTYPEERIYAGAAYQYERMRYLLHFKYDFKRKRCESKDLEIELTDYAKTIDVQLVDVRLEDDRVVETPRAAGVRIEHNPLNRMNVTLAARPFEIPAGFPFREPRSTPREPLFSLPQGSERGVHLLLQPYEGLNERIVSEVRRRVERCKSGERCGSIHAAVAMFSDAKVVLAFDEARRAGIDVDVIANREKRYVLGRDGASTPVIVQASPWQWIRRVKSAAPGNEILPMHTKFTVFDGDLVISSNGNYVTDDFELTREVSLEYHLPAAARIFEEIFTSIRTSLYYPVSVRWRDPVMILFNAARPRGYSASNAKPYLSIRTDEERSSSAYGVLYELLDRTPGRLTLMMSPITNSCAYYERWLCLDDLLAARDRDHALRMYLGAYFFLAPLDGHVDVTPPLARPESIPPALKAAARTWLEGFNLDSWRMPQLRGRSYGGHHERAALLGEDTLIAGSANWAQPHTLNTIEIVRNAELAKVLAEEESTFDEPYFVQRASAENSDWPQAGSCQFMIDRDLRPRLYGSVADGSPQAKRYRLADLRSELARRNVSFDTDGSLELFELDPDEMLQLDPKVGTNVLKPRVTKIENVTGVYRAWSSYQCVRDPVTEQEVVVRVVPAVR